MNHFVRIRFVLLIFFFCLLAGCRSHVIAVTVTNHSGAEIRNLEVNYPGGSFGKESLADGESYTYRIKTLRAGDFTIAFEDVGGHVRVKKGPKLNGNQEGFLNVEIQRGDIAFTLR
jgi:hypothetical protein